MLIHRPVRGFCIFPGGQFLTGFSEFVFFLAPACMALYSIAVSTRCANFANDKNLMFLLLNAAPIKSIEEDREPPTYSPC